MPAFIRLSKDDARKRLAELAANFGRHLNEAVYALYGLNEAGIRTVEGGSGK